MLLVKSTNMIKCAWRQHCLWIWEISNERSFRNNAAPKHESICNSKRPWFKCYISAFICAATKTRSRVLKGSELVPWLSLKEVYFLWHYFFFYTWRGATWLLHFPRRILFVGLMWTETRAKCLLCAQMCLFILLRCFHAPLKAPYENATTGTHWSKLGLNGTVHHEINKKDVFPLTFSAVCPTRLFWCELPSVGAISRRAVPSLGYNGTRWHRAFWCSKQKNTLGKNSRMSHRP